MTQTPSGRGELLSLFSDYIISLAYNLLITYPPQPLKNAPIMPMPKTTFEILAYPTLKTIPIFFFNFSGDAIGSALTSTDTLPLKYIFTRGAQQKQKHFKF